MEFYAGSFKHPACVRDMQGGLYITRQYSLFKTFDLLLFSSMSLRNNQLRFETLEKVLVLDDPDEFEK